AEAYRTIALRVVHHPRLAEPGGLLVVSVGEHTGAVSTAVNLAAALAETGRDVLLVEADPRSPHLAGRLPLRGTPVPGDGREPSPGQRSGQRSEGWPGGTRLTVDTDTAGTLRFVPGRRAADAARALNSPELERLLASAADRGEYAVVLTRPLPSHADGMAVAGRVRGVLVVCDPDRVHRDDLDRARELVESVGGHLLGAVLHPEGRGRWRPGRERHRDPSWTGRPETGTGALTGPEPYGARADTAYGSYGRYRHADDSTTLRT
ncbi:MAG TPA: hypothetical protein VFY14_17945, partial [Streptomyces sp.]|nr:hypothetical protein [Streptomyces sp.]